MVSGAAAWGGGAGGCADPPGEQHPPGGEGIVAALSPPFFPASCFLLLGALRWKQHWDLLSWPHLAAPLTLHLDREALQVSWGDWRRSPGTAGSRVSKVPAEGRSWLSETQLDDPQRKLHFMLQRVVNPARLPAVVLLPSRLGFAHPCGTAPRAASQAGGASPPQPNPSPSASSTWGRPGPSQTSGAFGQRLFLDPCRR